jgi:hypothetical protein
MALIASQIAAPSTAPAVEPDSSNNGGMTKITIISATIATSAAAE